MKSGIDLSAMTKIRIFVNFVLLLNFSLENDILRCRIYPENEHLRRDCVKITCPPGTEPINCNDQQGNGCKKCPEGQFSEFETRRDYYNNTRECFTNTCVLK